jgi:hypothetical protein
MVLLMNTKVPMTSLGKAAATTTKRTMKLLPKN